MTFTAGLSEAAKERRVIVGDRPDTEELPQMAGAVVEDHLSGRVHLVVVRAVDFYRDDLYRRGN